MSDDRIRPATTDDFRAVYGRAPVWRVQAVVAEDATGRRLGIGGVERQPTGLCLFMDISPEIEPRRRRRTLIRATRAVLDMARRAGQRVFAVRDADQPSSSAFLRHFGFAPFEASQQQEVWIWEQR